MSHLLRTENASGPREAAKETQGHSQLHFSNPAGNQLMEFSLQIASQKQVEISRHCHCKKFLSPPEKLISGILGIIWFALLVALVITTRVVSPYNNLSPSHPCDHCPKGWVSYSHNCYYIGVEKKTWNDSSVSCTSKNSTLLYIDSEEEKAFLQSLSQVSWIRVFRKRRDQLWVSKKDSTFKPKMKEFSSMEGNCVMLSSSGLTTDDCTALHTYLCERNFNN
ncbi:NKG2-A/NKG2-B type II integral membrane protein-like isoform X2 [Peromyscus californicus insignis]|uniref:NKG2-A/NKG2-B type II integral membrane protein-like isoform X2 n=1 Tax=Peromyscus californicus insignis TaxID=564181 RepID=UPI0022A67413|nr:NKG2-A/NKG2-B type II integral membrane protein-like isoform X2 [Peromyscus californicus insignis]